MLKKTICGTAYNLDTINNIPLRELDFQIISYFLEVLLTEIRRKTISYSYFVSKRKH